MELVVLPDKFLSLGNKVLSSVQSLSHVQLFVTPWTAARQASLSIANSWSLLKLMSIESVMHPTTSSSVVPFSSCPQSLPASGFFPMSQLFAWGGQSIGVSASAVRPKWDGYHKALLQGQTKLTLNTCWKFLRDSELQRADTGSHSPFKNPRAWRTGSATQFPGLLVEWIYFDVIFCRQW